ncbi:OB-fold nucleic acid binding domain-containing protein [Candidatus Nardonella dryophthoridicola]|uniref:OB-fold nucleic acid binding domain-containing protein n=1 Tax=Candidatus Nardonella dryophthoridicola TaxID=1971485 RepID=UPI003B9779D2
MKNIRNYSNKILFIELNDGTYIKNLQIIIKSNIINNDILKLNTGCSINIIGKLINSIGNNQKIEILSNKINILGFLYNNKNILFHLLNI